MKKYTGWGGNLLKLSWESMCAFPSSVPTSWPWAHDLRGPGLHRKLKQSHEYRNAFLLKCHLTSSIKHSAASGFDQSYIIRGSSLENTWNRQNTDTGSGVTVDLKVWVKEGLSLTWRQMLRISCEGMRPLSGRKGPPTAFWFNRTSGNPRQPFNFPLQFLLHSTN